MAYFGCIDEARFNELSTEVQNALLLKKEVFEEIKRISIPLNTPTNISSDQGKFTPYLIPSQGAVNELYSFVLKSLEMDIENPYLQFFMDFKEECFGLDIQEQKKIALEHFNYISEGHIRNAIKIAHIVENNQGIKQPEFVGKFSQLFNEQNNLKDELALTNLFFQYLFGNKKAFEKAHLEGHEMIKTILDFESDLKIVVSLNDKYNFENDFYFTSLAALKVKYATIYNLIFKSFEVYVFTHQIILDIKDKRNAQIESLYQAISELDLIHENASRFMRFVNDEYNFSITKMRTFEKDINRTHDKRVESFALEYSKFSSKK